MEIIHLVLGKANPQRMNGVNKVVYELATKQSLAGAKVQVWGIAKDVSHNYPSRNFETIIFKKSFNPFKADALLLQTILSKKGKAIFHIHGGFIPVFFTISQWFKKNNIPFITMTHGAYNTIAMQKNNLFKKIYFKFFESKLLKAATYIHCIGKSEITGLKQIFPNNKTVLIPYGFDMLNVKKVSPSTENFIIVFCGRLDVYTKGLNELLEGFKLFLHHTPNALLWIIGDGKEKEQLINKAKELAIHSSVIFHGSKFGDDKIALLQQCHVFASPSRNEGLPAAVLEAAALGIACLVTEATNTGDAINEYDAGYVIEVTDATLINQGLIILYDRMKNQTIRSILSNNASTMIEQHFSWSKTLNSLNNIYHLALTKNA